MQTTNTSTLGFSIIFKNAKGVYGPKSLRTATIRITSYRLALSQTAVSTYSGLQSYWDFAFSRICHAVPPSRQTQTMGYSLSASRPAWHHPQIGLRLDGVKLRNAGCMPKGPEDKALQVALCCSAVRPSMILCSNIFPGSPSKPYVYPNTVSPVPLLSQDPLLVTQRTYILLFQLFVH